MSMEQESPFGRTSNEMLDEDHFFDMDSDMDDAFKVCVHAAPLIFLTVAVYIYLNNYLNVRHSIHTAQFISLPLIYP